MEMNLKVEESFNKKYSLVLTWSEGEIIHMALTNFLTYLQNSIRDNHGIVEIGEIGSINYEKFPLAAIPMSTYYQVRKMHQKIYEQFDRSFEGHENGLDEAK